MRNTVQLFLTALITIITTVIATVAVMIKVFMSNSSSKSSFGLNGCFMSIVVLTTQIARYCKLMQIQLLQLLL